MAEEKMLTASELSEQEQIRREKLQGLVESGRNPYEIMKYDVTHLSSDVIAHYEELKETTVSLAGRMMGRHIMGKASFARLADGAGKIQLYFKRDDLGEDVYNAFKKYDLGDVIGVKGVPFVTKTGCLLYTSDAADDMQCSRNTIWAI